MTVEGTDDVGKTQGKVAGEVQPDAAGKFPETVSWSQYVGIKESLGGKLEAEREKVKNLEEQISKAIKQEDFEAVKQQLDEAKTSAQKVQDELKGVKDKSVEDKRNYLKSKGMVEADYADADETTLNAMIKVLDTFKPKPDFGSGGGTGALQGSPMELARQGYSKQ